MLVARSRGICLVLHVEVEVLFVLEVVHVQKFASLRDAIFDCEVDVKFIQDSRFFWNMHRRAREVLKL